VAPLLGLAAAVNSPEWAALAQDGPNLFAGGANAVVVSERVLRG
jgi:hypothetical protein